MGRERRSRVAGGKDGRQMWGEKKNAQAVHDILQSAYLQHRSWEELTTLCRKKPARYENVTQGTGLSIRKITIW